MDIEKAAEALRKIRNIQRRRAKAFEALRAKWSAKEGKVLSDLDQETGIAVMQQLDQERQKAAQADLPPWASEEPPPVEAVTVERKGKK